MSKLKCEQISYRNEKIDVYVDADGNDYVTIEGEKYLVVKAVDQKFITKYFIKTKEGDFQSLDDISKSKKHLNQRYIFDCKIHSLNDYLNDSDLLIFCNSIFLKKVTIKQAYTVSGKRGDPTSECLETSLPEVLNIPNFAFWNTGFEDECLIEFDHNKNNLSFVFNKCYFAKKLKIRNSEIRAQPLNGTDFGQYKIAQKTKLHLDKLRLIDCSAADGAYLRIGFVDVKDFVLSNLRLPQNAELNIGDCHFKNFKLTNFRNIGKFKLFKINIFDIEHNYFCSSNTHRENETKDNKKFQIDNTSIGKTDFQSVNIGSFDDVVIFDNIFTEIDYTNLIWGGKDTDIEVGQYDNSLKIEDKKRNKLEKQQDTYRTLKNVASKNNDQPQAIKFFAKEMDYHYQIVKNNQKYSLSDRATLLFNKYTNDFGLSFWKPLGWLLFFSIVFYFFVLCSFLDGYNSRYWNNIFEFLNPTHKTLFINEYHWSGWSYLWDFLFRIIEGLLIYQTIQAFRKYSRKL